MQIAWKANAGASSPTLVKPGVWEKTPPKIDAIQIIPSRSKAQPRTLITPFT